MDKYTAKRMARLARVVQPYCSETIVAALPVTRAQPDPTGSKLLMARQKKAGDTGRREEAQSLPEYVLLALSSQWIYAFEHSPRLIGYRIKRQIACWSRREVDVVAEYTSTVIYFVLTTRSGESYAFEASALTTPFGRPAVEFVRALGAVDYRSAGARGGD